MNDAMRNRGVLVLICVLVALVSSFCFGKQSLAKQPAKAPEPVGSAGSSRPASHSPAVAPNARRPAPAARSKPARWEPADRRPLSRPTHQRPIERPAPAGRHVPGPRHLAEPPGGQGAPFGHKPVPEQRPAHEPPGLREHGRGLGPKEPVGPNPVRHHPRPEQANKGHLSRPVQERPAPRTKSHYPHQSKDTGPREGAGPPDQPGKPASPPGRENVHPGGKGLAGPPEHGAAAGRKPDQKGGGRAHTPTIPREERPVHTGTLASAPDGGPSSIGKVGTEGPAGHQPPAQPLGSHARDSDIGSGAEPSHPQATISDPRSMDLRREEPDGAVGHAPALRPGLQAAKSSQTLGRVRGRDAVSSAAPPGEKPRPAGEQAQLAPETPLGSTKLLFDPLWEERGSLVDLAQEVLRSSVPGGHHNLFTGTPRYKGSIAQSGLPLEIPPPFFGFVPMLGGAATGFGSSGNGTAPLLAVVVPCLIALLCRGRSRISLALLRPATVPRPALERPG